MDTTLLILCLAFLATAAIYSSAGFGGGSTYLALLTLAGTSYNIVPTTALICNIVVVVCAAFSYQEQKLIRWRLILPFLITSVPFSYLGARLPIGKTLFCVLLAFSLLCAAVRLMFAGTDTTELQPVTTKKIACTALPTGSVLGFLSGLTGIGGGIFLSPILYLMRWGNSKEIAAASTVFILANSFFGLAGQLVKSNFTIDLNIILPLMIAVFVGGQIGTHFAVYRFNTRTLRLVTASLIFVASVNLFWKVLF